MTKPFDDILKALPGERQARILDRADALLDGEANLQAALEREDEEERTAMAGPMSFTIYSDAAGFFRFRLEATNGVVLADSASYATREEAARAVEVFKRNVFEAAA